MIRALPDTAGEDIGMIACRLAEDVGGAMPRPLEVELLRNLSKNLDEAGHPTDVCTTKAGYAEVAFIRLALVGCVGSKMLT